MAGISGKDGTVTIAGTGTINLRSWTVNDAGPASIDTTAFGDTWHVRVVGINDWSFSAEGTLDGSAAPAMQTEAGACVFTTAAGLTYTGNGICRLSPSVTIDGDAVCTVSGDGAGELVIA